ncbi:MAG: pilus assembly protein [Chloroflexi bacterium]|nr:pilus assembly protein [Chloroflexota bacterium]
MPKKLRKRFSGQGMVEFAIVLPVLLMLVLGLIEFGRLMFIYSAVTSAAREAARYGSAVGKNPAGTPQYLDCAGIRDAALRIANLVGVAATDVFVGYESPSEMNVPAGSLTPCPVSEGDITLGNRIVVEVNGMYNPIPALPLVNLPQFNVVSESRRSIIKNANVVEGGTSVGAIETPTDTPTPVPTITPGGPTLTPTPTITETPVGFNSPTPTPTATPLPISAPTNPLAGADTSGNNCTNIIFSWEPNSDWASNPGTVPDYYNVYRNGNLQFDLSPADPFPTIWVTGDSLANGATIEYEVLAVFPVLPWSERLTMEYLCSNGILINNTEIVVLVFYPVNGTTITDISETYFEMQAWWPTIGTNNGDGIDRVYINLIGPGGEDLLNPDTDEFNVSYCAFDGNGPCGFWDDTASILFAAAPNGVYTLSARAVNTNGDFSDWVSITFTLAKPATPTPTP